jgi:uncharacterized protein (DUF305 family)
VRLTGSCAYIASERSSRAPARSANASSCLIDSEIELMEEWLRERGEQPPTDEEQEHGHGGSLMPGMASPEQLDRLAAARGTAFNVLFLKYMMRHHRGALTMVEQLHAANGGAEAEIGNFTRHVEGDQGIEIARMQDLLADVEDGRSGPTFR